MKGVVYVATSGYSGINVNHYYTTALHAAAEQGEDWKERSPLCIQSDASELRQSAYTNNKLCEQECSVLDRALASDSLLL